MPGIKRPTFLGLILLTLLACDERYKQGTFPEKPINLATINTEFDDYNSDSPMIGETFPLCFSSTRTSKGGDYDIVCKMLTIHFSKETGKLDVSEGQNTLSDIYIENANIYSALGKINTSSNEFGPYLVAQGRIAGGSNMNKQYESYIFLYSNNSSGNQDIKFTQNLESESYEPRECFRNCVKVSYE